MKQKIVSGRVCRHSFLRSTLRLLFSREKPTISRNPLTLEVAKSPFGYKSQELRAGRAGKKATGGEMQSMHATDDSDTGAWWWVAGGAAVVISAGVYLVRAWRRSAATNLKRKLEERALALEERRKKIERNRPVLMAVENKFSPSRCQGFEWVQRSMKCDGDGDWAHGFFGPFSLGEKATTRENSNKNSITSTKNAHLDLSALASYPANGVLSGNDKVEKEVPKASSNKEKSKKSKKSSRRR